MVKTIDQLKAMFQTGSVPDEQQFIDLIDTLFDIGGDYPNITVGYFTPTGANAGNLSSVVTRQCFYIRVGTKVIFGGTCNVTITTSGVSTTLSLTIPITSDFTTIFQAGGSGVDGQNSRGWTINSGPTNNNLFLTCSNPPSSGATNISFMAMYDIV